MVGAKTDADHDLHTKAVFFAGRPEEGKLLHNALDRQHREAVAEFNKVSAAAALRDLWRKAVSSGQLPGAYWSILTHPLTDQDLARDVFGEVHMLSHLKGAANRAEFIRLHLLEGENARQTEKLSRQQQHIKEAFRARDEAIRKLHEISASAGTGQRAEVDAVSDSMEETLTSLRRQLAKEVGRRQQLETQFKARAESGQDFEANVRWLESQITALRRELETAEAQIAAFGDTSVETPAIDLAGQKVLYVGGRPHQVRQLRILTEQLGGTLLHHDGGVEQSANLLPNLLSRADIAVFPVDCISHDAAATVKRACSQSQKRFIPLRTSSLTCFLSALAHCTSRQ